MRACSMTDSELLKQILKNQTDGHGERLAAIERDVINHEKRMIDLHESKAEKHDLNGVKQSLQGIKESVDTIARNSINGTVLDANFKNLKEGTEEVKKIVTEFSSNVNKLQVEVAEIKQAKATRFQDLSIAGKVLLTVSRGGIIGIIVAAAHYIYELFTGK